MRLLLCCLLGLLLLGGCDVFGSGSGETAFTLSGDFDGSYEGDAFIIAADGDNGVTRSRIVLDGENDTSDYQVYIEAPGRTFAEGTKPISRTSQYSVRIPVLLSDTPRGVSGTVTITSVRGGEVSGSIDVGVARYGNEATRNIQGTFRAVER